MSMALAGLFAIIMCANMAYKMMVRREPLDVMKLFKPLAISIILCWWYPPADTGIGGGRSTWCALDFLSYIPNAIGSYTHDLYEAEAAQVKDRMDDVQQLMYQLGDEASDPMSTIKAASNAVSALLTQGSVQDVTDADAAAEDEKNIVKAEMTSTSAGLVMLIDKIIMLIALITFRIGWWGTIYCQQILLGMLTIFGPIQWAFSLLPKWEGAWAKWIIRYLTVHFYGAMLYFVSFRNFLTCCKSNRICFKKCLAQQTNTKSVPIKFLSYQRWYTATETQCKGNKNNRQSFLFIPLFYPRNLVVGFTERLSFVLTRFEEVHKILINRTYQNFNSMIFTEKSYSKVKLSQNQAVGSPVFLFEACSCPNFAVGIPTACAITTMLMNQPE